MKRVQLKINLQQKMEQVKEDRFVFQVEWFDKQADIIRNYLLTFYPGDGSIDMVSAAELKFAILCLSLAP